MREGGSTTGDVRQISNGYFQLATGTTAQRPSVANAGMMRMNSNTASVEYYANSAWNNIPKFGNTFVTTESLTLTSGSPTGNMIYWRDPDTYNKTLSVMMLTYRFSIGTASSNAWMQVDASITGSNIGYITPTPITLTFMSGFTDGTTAKSLSLWVDNVEYPNILSFAGGSTEEAITAAINRDIAAGQKIRLQVKIAGGGGGSIACSLYYMLRK